MNLGYKLLLLPVFVVLSLSLVLAVVPSGGTPTSNSNETAAADAAGAFSAIAGNVSDITITGYTTTQTWQGYFGNVSGTIQLADASDNVMYNWSLANPEGEVYASTSNAVAWATVECFNFTEDGSTVETNFNLGSDDVDGVDETFQTGNGHDMFYTNNIQFTEGECMSTQIYDSTGAGQDNSFEEVLLWDGANLIFTSLLEESSVLGFDGADHDFEMLVLEDGHGTNTATTTYYFYVELE